MDFAALVDSLARARETALGAQDVAVAVTHAEFGRVSLRFHSEDTALAVSLSSADPGFAPAVAAARAADAADSRAQGQTAPAPAAQSGLAGDSASARGGSQQRQDTPQQTRSFDRPHERTSANPRTETRLADDDHRRGAIWA
jgi:hypothetical protein